MVDMVVDGGRGIKGAAIMFPYREAGPGGQTGVVVVLHTRHVLS